MLHKFVLGAAAVLFASGILIFSIIRVAYATNPLASLPPLSKTSLIKNIFTTDINPESPVWPIMAACDRLRLALAPNTAKKSLILAQLSHQRLMESKDLMKQGKCHLSVQTLMKSNIYLREAQSEERLAKANGENTQEVLSYLDSMEKEHNAMYQNISAMAPEQIQPQIISLMNDPKDIFGLIRDSILEIKSTSQGVDYKG